MANDTRALWMIEQIRLAKSAREIAGYLLRVSDLVVMSHGVQLQAECARHNFAGGVAYLDLRAAALAAERDAQGYVPKWIGLEFELWRHTLSRFAAGQRQELPDFMRGADAAAKPT